MVNPLFVLFFLATYLSPDWFITIIRVLIGAATVEILMKYIDIYGTEVQSSRLRTLIRNLRRLLFDVMHKTTENVWKKTLSNNAEHGH